MAVSARCRSLPADGRGDRRARPVIALPTLALAGVCIYVFGAVLAELSARNWGAVFLRDTLGTSAAATGWALGAFSLMMAVGRLAGDRLADRFGPVALGRFCAFTGVAGMVALVVRQRPADGARRLCRHRLRRLGRLSARGQRRRPARADRPPAINVASVALIAYSGSLVGPPLVGFVADSAGPARRPGDAAAADGAERAVCRLACPASKEQRYRRLGRSRVSRELTAARRSPRSAPKAAFAGSCREG